MKLASAVFLVTIGLGLAACGGSSPAATGGQKGGQPTSVTGPGGGLTPGGSGKVTDVTGSTAQVQSQTAQVAVTWSGSTTFTQQVSVKATAVTVGSCVTVNSSKTGAKSTSSTVQAASVRILPAKNGANNGSCTFGRARGAGRPQGGPRPTTRPSGAPKGAPGRGGFAGGFGAVGKVTRVSDGGFTISSVGPPTSRGTAGTAKAVTVVTSAETTYISTEKATSAAVKVGRCVTSQGKADDTGAIAATSMAITDPVDGECGFIFVGQRPGGQS